MVMAAGLGTRMRPLTLDRPKPLIAVGGASLIDHTLDRLAAAGVERAIVNVHYLADMIEAHLADRVAPKILFSDERQKLMETGGGLVQARALLGEAPVFVANTDQVWTERGASALAAMKARWDGQAMDALLLLVPMKDVLGFDGRGDFFLAPDGRVGRRGAASAAPYAYTGVQILHPRVLVGREAKPFSTNVLWDEMLAQGRLFGNVLDGTWMHVGDPEGLRLAEAVLAPG
jgi:MurNAc alpha-1-phosphate uridylyltransferase